MSGIKREAYIKIVETAAPTGYVLDKTPHSIHIDPYDPALIMSTMPRSSPAINIVGFNGILLSMGFFSATNAERLVVDGIAAGCLAGARRLYQ